MTNYVFLSIIIPTYNEEKVIGKTLKAVSEYLRDKEFSAEVIVADGGSKDKTEKEVEKAKAHIKNIEFIPVEHAEGKGGAIKGGMLHAKGEFKAFIDADNGAPVEQLDKLFPKMKEGYDIVMGSRYMEGGGAGKRSLMRQIMSRGGNLLFLIFLGLHYKDTRCPLKMFRGKVADELFSLSVLKGFGFDTEILYLARVKGYKAVEVPAKWSAGKEKSHVSPAKDSIKSILEIFEIIGYRLRGKYRPDK